MFVHVSIICRPIDLCFRLEQQYHCCVLCIIWKRLENRLEKNITWKAIQNLRDISSQISSKFDCVFDNLSRITPTKTIKPELLAFEMGTHWSRENSPHKGPVMRRELPCHDVVMLWGLAANALQRVIYEDCTIVSQRENWISTLQMLVWYHHIQNW